ncbi:type II secretion system F family protein [Rhodococcus erythropolis]|uniref:type II secretion system F family protein n=1 Tax=Rhodococcus erythropolis TaxID=1833 RepID=UPI001BE5D794|nr:type II secretion system F family protein [Rhodococcus erythropolis]MBT2265981.1 type II secretion system F family protein [Rhodococcus erythropolis]
MYTLMAVLLVLLLLGALTLIYHGWKDRRDPTAPQKHRRSPIHISRKYRLLIIAGTLVGALTWMVSGWFIALPISPIVFVALPYLLGKPAAVGEIARLNAMEEWVRNLSGVLAVGTGIEQAIIATHKAMPEVLTDEISRLIQRLRTNTPINDALRSFATDLDDATGDLIVGSLIQSAAIRGSGLTAVLDRLSRSVAEDVRNRRAVEAARKGSRTTARWVTIITIGFITGLFVLTDYMAFYKTPAGQLIFVVEIAAFIGCLLWMKKLVQPPKLPRFLGTTRKAANEKSESFIEGVLS